jgi:hypothetical protein
MSVTLDANSTAPTTGAGVTTVNHTNLTVGGGSNRALVVQIETTNVISAVTVVWDAAGANQSCTLIFSKDAVGNVTRVQLWGLVAPVSGNKTLTVSWTTASDMVVNAIAFAGVDQTGGATTFPNSVGAATNDTTPTVTITSAVGNMTVDSVGNLFEAGASPTQTQSHNANTAGLYGFGSYAAGTASNTHAWTLSVARRWASCGTDILASSGITFVRNRPTNLNQAVMRGAMR